MWNLLFQECRTATDAIRAAAPGSNIQQVCVDDYPIKVSVTIKRNGSEVCKVLSRTESFLTTVNFRQVKIFETDQRNLFSKNPDRRTKVFVSGMNLPPYSSDCCPWQLQAIADIKAAVQKAIS